ALDRAIALNPSEAGARVNRGNVLLDLGDGPAAVAAFDPLVAEAPDNPVLHHHLGRAHDVAGQPDLAVASFRRALALRPGQVETWLQLARHLNAGRSGAAAEAVLDEGLVANPDNHALLEAKGLVLRASGERGRTLAFLDDLAQRHPDVAWIHLHLGDMVAADDRARGLQHLRRAVALEPDNRDNIVALAQVLERGRGPDEVAELDEAYELARRAMARGWSNPAHAKVFGDSFGRVCDFEALDALGDFKTLGRGWASAGIHVALLRHMARASSPADRIELLEQHRIWARAVEARAVAEPVSRAPRGPRSKIRLGVMSSDLRSHVVTHFAQPIFDHLDRDRFEVYAYSFFRGQEDQTQARIAGQVTEFRWRPDITTRGAAQMIADDNLDVLVELGGSTHMNKLEVMAYRPAPLQVSWLGYPHSSGLSTIDRLVCDPFNAPTDPGLLIERPLMLPRSWVSLGPAFSDEPAIAETSAQDRYGVVTFGT
ncbi:MAG: tetratricopeptide repeat protein, partial [Phenylobacterium sp.]